MIDPRGIHFNRIPTDRPMPRECWCVDIRAAYPSTLALQGWITPDTYTRAMAVPKGDRLKAVGMLATTRYVEQYRNAELIEKTRADDPLRPYFFAVCAIVGDHMEAIANMIGPAFLWYWVDGIFLDMEDPAPVADYLKGVGYDVSVERVERVHWSPSRSFLFYSKGGERTYLCVPRAKTYDPDEVGRMVAEAKVIA